MTKHNATNERVKRDYFAYLSEALGRDDTTIDGVATSIARFDTSSRNREYKKFHRELAVAFKRELSEALNARTGDRLSKSTVLGTVRDVRAFFQWLSREPGYRQHLTYADADYFNLSDKDVAVARAKREKAPPTLEQVHHVLATMPAATRFDRRDRALVALAALTGGRIGALASFRLGLVDLQQGFIDQDARRVATKRAKTFRTFFLPIGGQALSIFSEWVHELRQDHLWGPGDPLFPATQMGLNDQGAFAPAELSRQPWASSGSARDVFKRAFARADLPYPHPHLFRDMLVHYAFTLNLGPEAMKAWSQNLGHNGTLTTFTSYGQIPTHRQGEILKAIGTGRQTDAVHLTAEHVASLKALAASL